MQGQGAPGKSKPKRKLSFRREARKNIGLLIPAGLYAINSYLKFVMLLFFRPTTAKMLGNLKVCLFSFQQQSISRVANKLWCSTHCMQEEENEPCSLFKHPQSVVPPQLATLEL